MAARLVDFRTMLGDRAPWAALTVLAGIFTLLSLAAALGVVVRVFQDGHLAGALGGLRQLRPRGHRHLTLAVLIDATVVRMRRRLHPLSPN